jgi:hypothetical protein
MDTYCFSPDTGVIFGEPEVTDIDRADRADRRSEGTDSVANGKAQNGDAEAGVIVRIQFSIHRPAHYFHETGLSSSEWKFVSPYPW